MVGEKDFLAVLCRYGPLLTGSSVCVRHIHVYWLESKMADNALDGVMKSSKMNENGQNNIC